MRRQPTTFPTRIIPDRRQLRRRWCARDDALGRTPLIAALGTAALKVASTPDVVADVATPFARAGSAAATRCSEQPAVVEVSGGRAPREVIRLDMLSANEQAVG